MNFSKTLLNSNHLLSFSRFGLAFVHTLHLMDFSFVTDSLLKVMKLYFWNRNILLKKIEHSIDRNYDIIVDFQKKFDIRTPGPEEVHRRVDLNGNCKQRKFDGDQTL